MKRCYKCGNEWAEIGQVGFKESCSKCTSDLHVCLNCRFYDEHKLNDCQVPNVDPVGDKQKANFCEEFQFADRKAAAGKSESDKAKEKWNKLFIK